MTFSERERAAIYMVLDGAPSWGGSEEALLARDELYDALELYEFERRADALETLKATQQTYKLSSEQVDHLRATLIQGTMVRKLGRIVAPILRRLRAAAPAKEPKP